MPDDQDDPDDQADDSSGLADAPAPRGRTDGDASVRRLPHRLHRHWLASLDSRQRATMVAWGAFAGTFAFVRALTHWIRDGHGPSGGGMSVGGRHFHHYNIGIALLSGIGALTLRGETRHHRHPATAAAYGIGTALIVDEAALLIDLQDVYWAKDGRTSVDLGVGIIALGGLAVAGWSFWPAAARELRRSGRGSAGSSGATP